MKLSLIIPILNSHEAVARQAKHFKAMNLSDDIEFIFVDDGSEPPLNIEDYDLPNLRIHATNDKRPWTQGLARNAGAKLATGEYLLMTDIDHIISRESIEDVCKFTGAKMLFPRCIGVLLADGQLSQELDVLSEYGFRVEERKNKDDLYVSKHGNTFAIKKSIFEAIGGYDPKRCTYGHYAPHRKGEDCYFNGAWKRYATSHGLQEELGSVIYVFPIAKYHKSGDTNPMGLFHNLSHN